MINIIIFFLAKYGSIFYNTFIGCDAMESIINLDNVSYSVFKRNILNNISLSIKKGEFVSGIGGNGSGKSTLINVLAGIVDYSGYIDINGYCLNKENINNIRKSVSVVFDDINNVNVTENVSDEIAVGLNNLGIDEFSISKMVVDIAREFKIYNILNYDFASISNSNKVKVFLASALVSNPDILIIDDCLHQLSVSDKELIFDILNKYNKKKKLTIIMVTHDVNDTLNSNRVIVLSKGMIVFDGTPRSVFKNKDKLIDCGIEIPFMMLLSLKLMDEGVINHVYVDMRKLVDDIWK